MKNIDTGAAIDATDVVADPMLMNVAAGDFLPQAAAIDTGLDIAYDRNGTDTGLFNGAAPDIGCVETP